MHLCDLGWSPFWSKDSQFLETEVVRISEKHRGSYGALGKDGHYTCFLSGKIEFGANAPAELPAIGDWCRISPPFKDIQGHPAAIIEEVLPRQSQISRLAAGEASVEQILVANVDFALITTSANSDFNINRLYRYIYLAKKGKVEPIIVLSKCDLPFGNVRLDSNLKDIRIIRTSVVSEDGIEELRGLLKKGTSAVFLGSSGVGKSSLVNALLGKTVQKTKEIRRTDSRGQHTTTSSSLHFTDTGAMLIDTPGLRELQIFGDEEILSDVFQEIESFTLNCRFSDCSHAHEPDCGVRNALEEGLLLSEDVNRYSKMRREVAFANRKVDHRLATEHKNRFKKIISGHRQRKKLERK